MEWMQILALVAGGMMLFAIWPMYKNWRANPTEAQPGDWSTAIFILGLVMLFVLDADLVSAVAGGTHHKVRSVNRHLPVSAVYTLVNWLGRSSISSIIMYRSSGHIRFR